MANEFIARKGLLVLGDAGINGNLGVTGNADIIGDISATGNVGITGNTDITGAVSVTGNVGITGNTDVNGAVSVTGNVGVTGGLNVQGSISATGTVSNFGNINITGNSYFFQGTNTSSGSVSLIGVDASDLIRLGNAGYDIDVESDLLLDGNDISMTGNFGLTGALNINGTAGITGYFGVTGISQVDGTAGVTGYFGVTGILQVDGTAGFNGYIGTTADIKVFQNGEVSPILFIDEDQFLTFFDPGSVGGVVFLRTTSLFTGLTSTIDQTLVVNGGIVATQMALTGNAPSYLDIDGNLSVTGNVGVTGTSQITGTANVNGTAGVTGYLGVTGTSQIDGTANVNGTAGVTGYLGVTGTHNISGTANVTGYLGVSGAGTVLSVTGNSVFNGDVDVIGNLNYTGDLGITGAVGVTGNLTVNGTTITDGLVLTTGGATGYHLVATDNLSTAEWTRLEVNVQTVSGLGNTVTTNIRDYMYVIGADTSSGPVGISLPPASYGKIMIHTKDIGANSFTNNITITPDGTDTIVTTITGETTITLSTDGGALIFVSDGISTWWLM
jgi:predicted acyltransferase (DUF342 family)